MCLVISPASFPVNPRQGRWDAYSHTACNLVLNLPQLHAHNHRIYQQKESRILVPKFVVQGTAVSSCHLDKVPPSGTTSYLDLEPRISSNSLGSANSPATLSTIPNWFVFLTDCRIFRSKFLRSFSTKGVISARTLCN